MGYARNAEVRTFRLADCQELNHLLAGVLMGYVVQRLTVGSCIETNKYIPMPLNKISKEIFMSRREQETARMFLLERGWIHIKKIGIPCTQHICVTDDYLSWYNYCNTK
jgi:hypothetical protein